MTTIFEISNPSDKYTVEAEDWPVACVSCLIIGKGNYGLREIDGDHKMPIFLLAGFDEWVEAEFEMTAQEFVGSVDKMDVAACLNSIVVGDRAAYMKGLGDKTGEEADAFWEVWDDLHRSSLNNMGGYARNYAANIIKQYGGDNAGN